MYAIVAPADGSLSAFARRSSSPSSRPRPAIAVPNPVAPARSPHPRRAPHANPRAAAAAASASASASASAPIVGRIPGFRRRVAECNEITPDVEGRYVPLAVAGVPVGLLQHHFADALVRAGRTVFNASARGVMDPEVRRPPNNAPPPPPRHGGAATPASSPDGETSSSPSSPTTATNPSSWWNARRRRCSASAPSACTSTVRHPPGRVQRMWVAALGGEQTFPGNSTTSSPAAPPGVPRARAW